LAEKKQIIQLVSSLATLLLTFQIHDCLFLWIFSALVYSTWFIESEHMFKTACSRKQLHYKAA
jgi:hypothetical protein